MIAEPTLALDLPLKTIVFEDANGTVRVTHNSPQYLKKRHSIPDELLKNISSIVEIVESLFK